MSLSKSIKRVNWEKLILELMVVFLGVTAGFILNNRQQDRQAESLEIKYLEGFLKDVAYNLEQIVDQQAEDSAWMMASDPYIGQLISKSVPGDSSASLFMKVLSISSMSPKKGTYVDITHSGNLNLIQNFELKEQIVSYHLSLDESDVLKDFFQEYFNSMVVPFVFDSYDLIRQSPVDDEVIFSMRFSNVFVGYYSIIQQRSASNKLLITKSKALKKALEQEIADRK